jgi:hypothetical protein
MRSPGCLSDLRIDMLLAGDLGAAEAAGARAHAAACAVCCARVAEIEGARAASEAAGAPDLEALRRAAAAPASTASAARRSSPPSPWRRVWPPLGAALAVGAAALVLVVRAPEPAPPATGTRIKGGARIGFFVKHGEAVRRGGPGEVVNPGDLVRFTATSAQPAHLTIIGVDAAGAVSVYFPLNGGADDVAAGDEIELPRATALDDTLGPETVHATFCARPLDAAAIEAARAALRASPQATPPVPPGAGCTTDKLVWTKVRAP